MDEPTDYDGWLERGRRLYGRCHTSQAHDRAYAAAGIPHQSPFRQCFDGARVAFDRAIALRPDAPDAWLMKGQLLVEFEKGHEEEARPVLERAIELQPANGEAWMWLGLIASRRGNLELAKANLAQAVSLDPHTRDWAVSIYDVPDEAWEQFFGEFFPEE